MHYAKGKLQFFARLNDEAKLADCLERIEYLYKMRSKEKVPSREIYFNSNFEANRAKRAKKKPVFFSPAASPAANEEGISLESEELVLDAKEEKSAAEVVIAQSGKNIALTKGDTMTPADKYIASKYETAIGMRLDLEAIRLYLLSLGIKRTPAQVVFDLDERYGFYGYAASNPAPRRLTYAEIDAQLEHPSRTDRPPSKVDRVVPLPPIGRPMGRGNTNTNRQGTI